MFLFNDPATPEISTLSLHDALPISRDLLRAIDGVELIAISDPERCCGSAGIYNLTHPEIASTLQQQKVAAIAAAKPDVVDRKSTRLNSSHTVISYAVFCLKKKKKTQ